MKPFHVFHPTEIIFGCGRLRQLGKAAARWGQRALLVTVPPTGVVTPVIDKARALLESSGLSVAHYDGVVPNPTTAVVAAGTRLAREHRAEVIIGLGGGSSMDTAKAIAVELAHEGSCWEYRLGKAELAPHTLPVIAVTTTSGTGSQVTQVAVVTNTQLRDKSYLCDPRLFPKVAIVDPELMLTAPRQVTAPTGWDAFTHAFEAFLHRNSSPYVRLMALEAIRLVASNLPPLLDDPANLDCRSAMAWADTLAGLCVANAGVILPHSIGMAISGRYPHVVHGDSLAVIYPTVIRYIRPAAVPHFAAVGRILNPELAHLSDDEASEQACVEIDRLLERIGLAVSWQTLGISADDLDALAAQSLTLPDYRYTPRVADQAEIRALLGSVVHGS